MSKAKEWCERVEKLIDVYEQRIAVLERQVAAITPGRGLAEYLAAMSERDALRERVAELEAQAAAPPECVVKLLEATKYRSDETGMLGAAVAKHYGRELQPTPEPAQDGHAWRPVDAEHPLTKADDGRTVRLRCNKEDVVRWLGTGHDFPFGAGTETYTPAGENYFDEARPVDIIAVLRPKPVPEPPTPVPAPDNHEWQPVDAEHPLTADDHRRMVRLRNGEEWMMAWGGGLYDYPARVPYSQCAPSGKLQLSDHNPSTFDIVAVLRPKTAPEPPKPQPGEVWESVRADTGGDATVGEVVATNNGLRYLVPVEVGGWFTERVYRMTANVASAPGFGGRKLTRRVS